MPARIRLQRRGKKGQPFYHIVVADGRAPRDGRFIEKIGTYNPLTNPATIVLDFDRAYHWISCGAQPSDTARSLLKREGIYMKKHLMGGVQKGAFDETEAQKRFDAWKQEKQQKIKDYQLELLNTTKKEAKKRFDNENKIRQEKEAVINEKRLAELEKTRKIKEEAEAKEAAEQAEAQAQIEEVAEATQEVEAETKTTEEVQATAVEETAVEETAAENTTSKNPTAETKEENAE